ncbi:hypothetical protein MPER_02654 [Moniliophthora perniciosa FA553]|nr:hypothetical protein MPER_02654 [Moniliophthora perniciosa FA553]
MAALADFLVSEARILERGSEHHKKEIKEQVPYDRVKDAPAVARELRWRVRHALGSTSDDESNSRDRNGNGNSTGVARNGKRKRARSDSASETPPLTLRFKNFKPETWDNILETFF